MNMRTESEIRAYIDGYNDCFKQLDESINDDVVEVVRCKDCIHNYIKSWNQGKRDYPRCHFTDLIRSNEFYCGFGEGEEE